ncbi:hypothetical protein [Liquorilactobacillus satsumensis]|uniref:hypothetical protein n=1 Tax=Liquorilactobacillus satsumensis TaxID=259059 RepID=UPI00345D9D9F
MEIENIRETLKVLLDYNNSELNPDLMVGEYGKSQRKATVEDVQELNLSLLTSIADLLGMSDLYLTDEKE